MENRFKNYYKWIVERYEQEENLVINEGLIKSYPVDVVLKDLRRRYENKNYDNKTGTILIKNIPLRHKKGLISKLDSYGYFIGEEQLENNDLFGILIEPKFPNEIPFQILHDKIHYCYHITTDKYIDKIKRIGLVPKESNRKFYDHSGNRIYFLISDNPSSDLPLLKKMLSNNDKLKDEKSKPEKYFLLRINFNELNNDMVFYRDPRLFPEGKFKGLGIFTLSNVPPDKIEILGEI